MKTLIQTITALFAALAVTLSAFAADGNTDVRTITITGTDNMKFDVTLIEAEPGERIKIVLRTVSNMPATSMAHNVAIVDQGVDLEAFVMASMTERDNEFIAPSFEDRVIANTEMIGGGETSSIEFTVPETPGDYDYVCTFPGHYYGGMTGILRVQ
ncbi:MAG: plastocyanin/azurin family copper-binding protein [Balneolaceae bacterium]